MILIHLAYRTNAKKKHALANDIVTVLKARGKRALADVNCYCKMTSVSALDGVTSFLRLKDATYHMYSCLQTYSSTYRRDFFGEMAESWKKYVFVVYCVLKSK